MPATRGSRSSTAEPESDRIPVGCEFQGSVALLMLSSLREGKPEEQLLTGHSEGLVSMVRLI